MMNNNCHGHDSSKEFLLLRCNKPFHCCSKNTHITFLLINFLNNRHVKMNRTFHVIGLLLSCLVSLILTPFALPKWFTQSLLIATEYIKVK